MPGLNKKLFDSLTDPTFWADFTEEEKIELLDTILAADPDDEQDFRNAVNYFSGSDSEWRIFKDDADTWVQQKNKEKSLLAKTWSPAKVDDFYKTNDFLTKAGPPTFEEIQQAAAAERVKYSFSQPQTPETLLKILTYNTAECRSYLAELIPKITKGPKWVNDVAAVIPSPPGFHGRDTNLSPVLTDTTIKEIQIAAVLRWSKAEVTRADSIVALDDLIKKHAALKKDDITTHKPFKDALLAAIPGFPVDMVQDLISVDPADWKDVMIHASAQLDILKKRTAALDAYHAHIGTLKMPSDPSELAKVNALLLKMPVDPQDYRDFFSTENAFKNPALDPHRASLTAADADKLRTQLGDKYLREFLKSIDKGDPKYLDAMKAATPNDFITALLQVHKLQGHDYIRSLTPLQIKDYKEIIGPQVDFKKTFEEAIKAIPFTVPNIAAQGRIYRNNPGQPNNVDTLKGFQAELNTKSLPASIKPLIPYIKEADMQDLKKAARLQHFEMLVQNTTLASQEKAYPELTKVFANLSTEVQEKILHAQNSDAKVRTPDLQAILSAPNLATLKHYMPGLDDSALTPVLKEIQRNSALRTIHNPYVAKILAELDPPVDVDETKIGHINQLININNANDTGRYIIFVKQLQTQLAIPPASEREKAFYQAFGISADGATVAKPRIQNAVNDENQHNAALLAAYQNNKADKKFLGMLLSIPKASNKGFENEAAIIGDPIAKTNGITWDFEQAKGKREAFISSYMAKTNLAAAHKEIVAAQITPALFHDVNKAMDKTFLQADPAGGLKKITLALEQMQNAHKPFAKAVEKMKFVLEIDEVHLNSPLFKSKSTEMRASLDEFATQSAAYIDQLKYDKKALEEYQGILTSSRTDATKKKIDPLLKDIEKQLAVIDEQIVTFTDIHKKLSGTDGLLAAMDRAKTDHYTYKDDSLYVYPVQKTALQAAIQVDPNKPANTGVPTVQTNAQSDLSTFMLKGLKSDEVMVYDFKIPVTPQAANAPTSQEARFTYEVDKDAISSTGKKDKVSQDVPGKYELHKFPTDPKARVDFAMMMAAQIIADMSKAPTKDNPIRLSGGLDKKDEIAHIWTALVILGEKTPHMKFNASAIQVNSKAFDPSKGFDKESLYKKEFKEHSSVVEQVATDLAKHTKERFDTKGVKKTEKEIKEMTDKFKETMFKNREETIKERQQKEGPVIEEGNGLNP